MIDVRRSLSSSGSPYLPILHLITRLCRCSYLLGAAAMAQTETHCTLLVALPDRVSLPSVAEITAELESTDPTRKIAALKKTIMLVLAGEESASLYSGGREGTTCTRGCLRRVGPDSGDASREGLARRRVARALPPQMDARNAHPRPPSARAPRSPRAPHTYPPPQCRACS